MSPVASALGVAHRCLQRGHQVHGRLRLQRRGCLPAGGEGVHEKVQRLGLAEAEREGWLGELEGLRVSLAGAEDRLGQISRRAQTAPTSLGMPTTRSTDCE